MHHQKANTMDCSICFNAITSSTGKVELSCSHPFHFSCLTTWFDKQKLSGAHENCPLCRHEANEFEKMPAGLNDEEDDDDDTWEYEDDEEDIAAAGRAAALFERLKAINPIEEVQLYAANRIKACWRGYQDRLLYQDLLENKDMVERHEEYIAKVQKHLKSDIQRKKFLNSIIGLSRTQVKYLAATKIQALCRGYLVKSKISQIYDSAAGVWRKIRPGYWEKVVMNPEEHEHASITF